VEEGKDKIIYANAAYVGEEVQKCIPEDVKNRIHEKRRKNKKLTKKQERDNKAKSHIRARVEHVFGMITNTMKGITVRSIGIARAAFNIGIMNLAYNLSRYAYLRRIGVCT
jgi:IS5 family transposase